MSLHYHQLRRVVTTQGAILVVHNLTRVHRGWEGREEGVEGREGMEEREEEGGGRREEGGRRRWEHEGGLLQ